MNSLVQDKIEALKGLCVKYRVKRLDLFGSATRDDFDPETSDLDFLVEFEPMSPVEHGSSFLSLLEDLERLFGTEIDLLEPEPIVNPYLWQSIERSRKVLYEAGAPPADSAPKQAQTLTASAAPHAGASTGMRIR